jgi:pimeloyl-ACP methyl ester carboxylesterase
MKLSRQTRETIKIVIAMAVFGLLLGFYVIYPLNRAKVLMGRADLDSYNVDSIPPNSAALYIDAGLPVDTFRVEADGLTNLGCLGIMPDSGAALGSVILIHGEDQTRDSLLPLATDLHAAGYRVIAYDQRSTGSSTGRYHGEGQYEATDLQALIGHLYIHEQIVRPLALVGYGIGADAALLATDEEPRVDRVIAIRPYLSTSRWLNRLRERHGTIHLPFFRTVMWFWYDIRSGYAAAYRDPDQVKGVRAPSLVLLPAEAIASEEATLLKEKSADNRLTISDCPTDPGKLSETIVSALALTATVPPSPTN